MRLPLGTSDYLRGLADIPRVQLLNRYHELDPTNQTDQVALISRPGLRKWLTMATQPVREVKSFPGAFNEAIFAVAGDTLYRIDQDETVTTIGTLDSSEGAVSMDATDTHLFIADGLGLKFYTTNAFATGTLTATGAIAANDVVQVGANYYKFTAGDVDDGAPAGTTGNPWLVALGANNSQALGNLAAAIDESGTAGEDYSSTLQGSTEATVYSYDSATLVIRAMSHGTGGNSIATTETGANLAWGAATLAGGGAITFDDIDVPDGDGVISVGVIAGFCICVVAQGFDKNGRFYWIEPGETTIDALNFATAERSPDPLFSVRVNSDQFWLFGSSTTEVWYPSGQPFAPFLRQQGRLFDGGIWEGTDIIINGAIYFIDALGDAWEITDRPNKISSPGIAQRFREAINAQREA